MSFRHSVYDDENESQPKKCRACSDFKNWAKQQTISDYQKNKTKSVNGAGIPEVKECPLDREELGRSTWAFLHTMAAYFPKMPSTSQQSDMKQFLNLFSRFYPCKECADDLQVEISKNPPRTSSQYELSQWMCQVHNNVNKKLGKPLFDCTRVDERWLHGWKDGSCD